MFTWASDLDGCALAWLLIKFIVNFTLNLLIQGDQALPRRNPIWRVSGSTSMAVSPRVLTW